MKLEIKGVTIEIDGGIEDIQIDYENSVIKIKANKFINFNPVGNIPTYSPVMPYPGITPFTPTICDTPGLPNLGTTSISCQVVKSCVSESFLVN